MDFHYLVRAIVFGDGKVLLVRKKGAGNTFLPGGHVDSGERAESALAREIEEEIGKQAIVKRFVGAVEHTWVEEGRENHEINLVFEVEVPGLDSSVGPESLEADLEFIWSDPADLESHNLQPYPLIECLKNYASGYGGFWGTTLMKRG
jgi:8-oxo-dGTP pyrophosphatase MutT (NUDIX family)